MRNPGQHQTGPGNSFLLSSGMSSSVPSPLGALTERERLHRLFTQYQRPGPRYTSYPTAVQFNPLPPAEETRWLTSDPQAKNAPLSLYFHLPFCPSLCTFCGCHTIINRDPTAREEYLDLLAREMDQRESVAPLGNRPVVQIHWGGGSPSFLDPGQIRRLGKMIRERYKISCRVEYSVEIDPRQVSRESIRAFAEIGVNRASLGVQDVSPEVQRAINRWQPQEVSERVITWLQEEGITAINCDLIYGLPKQTRESFRRTLDEVLAWRVDRLTVFGYAHVPWVKPAQKVFEKKDIILSPETRLEILEEIHQRIPSAGYEHLGLDHFALPHDPLAKAFREGTMTRNFQGYATLAGVEIAAFGISAIGQTMDAYVQNVKDLSLYRERLTKQSRLPLERGVRLTREDQMRRDVIMRIMCGQAINQGSMVSRWGPAFGDLLRESEPQLEEMEADGLITFHGGTLEITPHGRFFLRNIAMAFDAYLQKTSGPNPVYSKTL